MDADELIDDYLVQKINRTEHGDSRLAILYGPFTGRQVWYDQQLDWDQFGGNDNPSTYSNRRTKQQKSHKAVRRIRPIKGDSHGPPLTTSYDKNILPKRAHNQARPTRQRTKFVNRVTIIC